jgi:hypothetical protein
MQKAIAVRNLLRGFYLGVPSGEEVAQRMGETPLTPEQVSAGPHQKLLEDPACKGRTPLWYYILLEDLAWRPQFGRRASESKFEMIDLLDFNGEINPLGG